MRASRDREPLLRITWTDRATGRHGYVVVDSLVGGLATGGTRMRRGCTLSEVEDLARGMSLKTAAFGIPVGGAKGGIDCDPHEPEARGILSRFVAAMRPVIEAHWVTAEDLGVPQHLIDEVFAEAGLGQSYHAAIRRAPHPQDTLARVLRALHTTLDGVPLGDVIGGYGVAEACLAVAEHRGWRIRETAVAVQGFGTMGGGAARYLARSGARVVCVADVEGTLYDPDGLDVEQLLEARDAYGRIDRSRVPATSRRLPREAVLSTPADILVPAAVSYAIDEDTAELVRAQVVVEAANAATTAGAERQLLGRGVPVVPDFVANTGAAAWAWWVLLGWVDEDPQSSLDRLARQMRPTVTSLMRAFERDGIPPRVTATQISQEERQKFEVADAAGEVLAPVA